MIYSLKERKRKLDDISQLSEVTGFEVLDLYYKPPKIPKGKKKAMPNIDVTLQDLFTVSTDSDKIELLFFSIQQI